MLEQIKALEAERDTLVTRMTVLENMEGADEIGEALMQAEYEEAEDRIAVITVKIEALQLKFIEERE
jgi:hypothetical protein